MTRLHACNQCGYSQETPLPFEVNQRLDEEDSDGDQIVVELDLCSAQCLSNYAMGLTLAVGDPLRAIRDPTHRHPRAAHPRARHAPASRRLRGREAGATFALVVGTLWNALPFHRWSGD